MKAAKRVTEIQEYYFSRKLKEIAKRNAAGEQIISLAIGSPDLPPSKQTIEKLCEVSRKPDAHGYQPTVGTPELRAAMAGFYRRWYGVALDAQTEILPLIGSKEGILHTTLAFVDPGDKVLVPDPGYPTYTSLPTLLGGEVVYYNLKPENDWQPDFDELESMDLTGVKMLWSNYPHMPTGAPALRSTYERLVDFARRHAIVVVNDNPYSFILNHEPMSLLQVEGAKELCVEFNSMSKSHNMPGWRVGMCVTNAEWTKWILKVKSNIDSGTFRALQLAAVQAFDNSDEWHNENNFATYERRRRLAWQIMDTLRCQYATDSVGMFVWGRIPDDYANVEDLTGKVLHEARVFLAPGFIFGSNGRRYIRISLCAKEEKMAEALRRIQAVFEK